MEVLIDKNTLDSIMLDTTNVAYLAENFTFLIKKLQDYIDPTVSNEHEKMPNLKGGARRIERADRGAGLGYQYIEAAGSLITKSGQSKIVDAFGSPILVDVWTVSHPHIEDPQMGETYPTQDRATKNRSSEPRGPYTCLITARISLSKKTPTRCYVQCNCKDFQTKFYEQLHNKGYTNKQNLKPAANIDAPELQPAICKHLYAIYKQQYASIIAEVESGLDENPTMFGLEDRSGDVLPPPPIDEVPKEAWPVAKNKQEALGLIAKKLKIEHDKIKLNPDAYFDTRVSAGGGSMYHRYPFSVILLNGNLRAIAYRNKNLATSTNNSQIKVMNIENNPKIWSFLKFYADHGRLWSMIKALGEMPDSVKDKLKAAGKKEPIFDSTIQSITDVSLLEAGSSNILSSISELS